MFDNNKCMARLSNNLKNQCNNKKKPEQDYCGIHIKSKNIIRIDNSIQVLKKEIDKNIIDKNIIDKNIIDKNIIDIFSYNLPNIKKLKVSKIKLALTYYNLVIKKKKVDNYNLYLEFLTSLDEYKLHTNKILKIQKLYRGYKLRLLNSYKGPALFNRKSVNNECDFFTFETINEIHYDNFFSFKDQDGFIYAFNIKSINELLKNDDKNPYTRNTFHSDIKINLEKIKKNIQKNIEINIEIKSNVSNDPYIKMKRKCVYIFQKMDELELYTQVKWFLDLNLIRLKKLYTEIEDIWNYRAMLTYNMKTQYIDTSKGKIFSKHISHINKINNKLILQNILLDYFERFAFEGSNKENCITSCYWILTGLTMVSQGAAEGYPHLVQSSSIVITS